MFILMSVVPLVAVAAAGMACWLISHLTRHRCKVAADRIQQDAHDSLRKLKQLDDAFVEQIVGGADIDAAFQEFTQGRVRQCSAASDAPWLFDSDDLKKRADTEKSQRLAGIQSHGRLVALATCTVLFVVVLVMEAILYAQASTTSSPAFSPVFKKSHFNQP